MFAIADGCTIDDKQRVNKCKMAKGWKIPQSLFREDVLQAINGICS